MITGPEEAFAFVVVVPTELLFDQMKAVILEDQRLDGGKLLENPGSCASRRTGASVSSPADRITPRQKAKWSAPSDTSGATSSTGGSSSATRISMHLQPLAAHGYCPLVLPAARTIRRTVPHLLTPPVPTVEVE